MRSETQIMIGRTLECRKGAFEREREGAIKAD